MSPKHHLASHSDLSTGIAATPAWSSERPSKAISGERTCACGTKLSVYNSGAECGACEVRNRPIRTRDPLRCKNVIVKEDFFGDVSMKTCKRLAADYRGYCPPCRAARRAV
jgi:hypothetical protein